MRWDEKMMLERKMPDGSMVKQYARPNNTNLNEDLGMVEYVFSDKTGTLTQNDMVLAKLFVNGKVFDDMSQPGSLFAALSSGALDATTQEYAVLFGRALALAHDVLPAVDKTGKLEYESSSPDETALLNAAAQNNFKLLERTKAATKISTHFKTREKGKLGGGGVCDFSPASATESYTPLFILEFTSDRKRMSSIVRAANGDVHLYCKGADNIMLPRLSKEASVNSPDLISSATAALEEFSNQGLRTLVVGFKVLGEKEYAKFHAEYTAAEKCIDGREAALARACELVERDLVFLGCTAIEDRLQQGVPETIDYLLKAHVKLWLLTGDKMETAINIGYSSKLLNSSMTLHTISGSDVAAVSERVKLVAKAIEGGEGVHALVVNGDALAIVLNESDAQLSALFLQAGTGCRSVICCRTTPFQKALVVKLVKNAKRCITLAIGDGANDVSMIQSANIGVGIMGREGTQAVRAADYAFGEFRFLKRLMAVHGRYSYMRIATVIMFSFYKNLVLINIYWWFGWTSLFSGNVCLV